MKNTIFTLITLAIFGLSNLNAQVGIGTTTPHTSSILDLDVTSQATKTGFLPPRMTTEQRNDINGGKPAEGLVIYNTTAKCLQWFDGDFWINACGGAPEASPNLNLDVSNVTYQGQSVIDATGIGYNGEAIPTASTITVELRNSSADPQNFGLVATDSATGLTYSATGMIAGSDSNVSVILTHNAPTMPEFFSGVITMPLTGANNIVNLVPRIDVKSIPASETVVNPVTYGTQTWMDRNLGARRKATAINDVYSYGNHYQWGRPADGHEISVWNGTTKNEGRGFYDATALEALAISDTPGIPNFILTNMTPYDWQSDNNNNRWATANQGPCPSGFHVPNNAEWNTADAYDNGVATNGGGTVGWDDNAESFESDLKLPSAGNRRRMMSGVLNNMGVSGFYWASTVSSTDARYIDFNSTVASTYLQNRAWGFSVRCLKD